MDAAGSSEGRDRWPRGFPWRRDALRVVVGRSGVAAMDLGTRRCLGGEDGGAVRLEVGQRGAVGTQALAQKVLAGGGPGGRHGRPAAKKKVGRRGSGRAALGGAGVRVGGVQNKVFVCRISS